jgi:hypothetical protein
MSSILLSVLSYGVIGAFGLLGIHHFIEARRGLRTGTVEGLVLGCWDKTYDREYDPELFWVNVWVAFLVATVAAVIVFFAAVVSAFSLSEYFGFHSRVP